MNNTSDKPSRLRHLLQGSISWLLAIVLTIGLTAAFALDWSQSDVVVEEGQPAASDIFAPRDASYVSQVLTEQKRQEARNNIPEQYTPLDLSIGRGQLNQARLVFSFIETVRADTLATTETKLNYLKSIVGLTIEDEVGLALLTLSNSEYATAKADILGIIDELMRQEIRDTQLSDVRRSARRQASLELTPAQNLVVTSLAPQFIVETVFPDPETTAKLRDDAANAVEPVLREIQQGQRIVRAGDLVSAVDVEALVALGLMRRETVWHDVARIFIASLLTAVILTIYWHKFHKQNRDNLRYAFVLAVLILFFAVVARFMLSGFLFLAYWFPMASLSMLLAVVFDVRLSMVATMVMAALVGYAAPNSLELAVYTAVGGLLSVLTLRDAQRMTAFFRAGLIAAVGYMLVILMYRFAPDADVVVLTQLLLYALANGILSAGLTLAGFFIIGSVFGLTTTLQLQDLARLDHPLLQELLRRAPGTYHHSIMVANLAEQAAEEIPNADSTLVRVGAFYHDIGKMNRPPFFVENQEGINPHDALDPYSSARIIISHVSDGLELAKKYRLPERIKDFIAEHHGDRIVRFFYQKALEEAERIGEVVDESRFRHKGPRPRSPETGIVMLADAVEAASSALHPNSASAIEKLVNSLIDEHVMEGQLDNSGLTLGDIAKIRVSFIKTLKGRFHVRVKYPGNEAIEQAENSGLGQTAVSPAPQSTQAVATANGDPAQDNENLAVEAP